MQLRVHGKVPQGSGLSSSSALTARWAAMQLGFTTKAFDQRRATVEYKQLYIPTTHIHSLAHSQQSHACSCLCTAKCRKVVASGACADFDLTHAISRMQLLVHGEVPQGSGLSSSSALVVAVAVAILAAYGCQPPLPDIAAFTCSCERHVGVASGGMDQAISVMARPGVPLVLSLIHI